MANLKKDVSADLEFMRSVVAESHSGHISRGIGLAMLVAGIAYGVQSLFIWGQINNIMADSETLSLGVTVAATSSLLITLGVVFFRKRTQLIENSLASRAVSAIFFGFGLSVLGSATVFAIITLHYDDIQIWQLFGAVFAVLQASVWGGTGMIKKTTWFAYIAVAWFAMSIGLAVLYGHSHYLLLMSAALFLLMAIPGYFLWRKA